MTLHSECECSREPSANHLSLQYERILVRQFPVLRGHKWSRSSPNENDAFKVRHIQKLTSRHDLARFVPTFSLLDPSTAGHSQFSASGSVRPL